MKSIHYLLLALVSNAAAESCFPAKGAAMLVCIDDSTGLATVKTSNFTETEQEIIDMDGKALADATAAINSDLDTTWVFVSACLVFIMQAGFSLVEAGCVSERNVQNIFYKNLMDAVLGCLSFWLLGYAFAYGDENDNAFIGAANFGLSLADNEENSGHYISWFFQFVFAATAATIVSGAVAERCQLSAYFIYSVVLTTWIYPVVVHWVWDAEGWLTAFGSFEHRLFKDSCEPGVECVNGLIDFAGSGVVHMVGGFSALVAASIMGPRKGRFDDEGNPVDLPGHSLALVSLGVFLLWFGWYGFNGGSTLMVSGGVSHLAAKVAVTTTISASACCFATTIICLIMDKNFSLGASLNGVLAGLVSITAGCSVVSPTAAFFIGLLGAPVYVLSAKLMIKLKIDDPVDAAPIHGFCGIWGVLSVGIFATRENINYAYGYDNDAMATGLQFATQLVGVLAILAWTLGNATMLFLIIKHTVGLRVSEAVELYGLDAIEHGGAAYHMASSSDHHHRNKLRKDAIEQIVSIIMDGAPAKHDHGEVIQEVFALFTKDDQVTAKQIGKVLKSLGHKGITADQIEAVILKHGVAGKGGLGREQFNAMLSPSPSQVELANMDGDRSDSNDAESHDTTKMAEGYFNDH